MEKRISYRDFQSIKSLAKAIDPKVKERETLKAKIAELTEKYNDADAQISLLEAGIVKTLGFHVTDLVKKVVEPTGANDPKTGKPIKVTKFMPTDRVKYDEVKKQYVITIPEEPIEMPTTEGVAGNDFDIDKERVQPTEIDPVDSDVIF